MTGIYLITNTANGKRYVGQSVNIQRRFREHKKPGSNSIISRAIRKYGASGFTFEVLEECSVNDLDMREIYWIDTLHPEYNINHGCINVGTIHCFPAHVVEKIRGIAKRQWAELPEEKKSHICKYQLIGPRKGHHVSDETRDKLRKANQGKTQSLETIEKRRESMRLRRERGIVKDASGHFKKVICIETGTVYESVKAAAAAIGVQPSLLSHVLKGRQHMTRNLHFKYCGVETIRDECSEVGLR